MITNNGPTHSTTLTISDQVSSGLWPWQKLTVSILDDLAHKLLIRYIHNRLFSGMEAEMSPHQAPAKVLEDAVSLMGESCRTRSGYHHVRLLIAVLDGELILENIDSHPASEGIPLQWIRNPQD